MPRYVFHMQIAPGQAGRLHELNEQYTGVLDRAASAIPGLRAIEKYVLGEQYVELIDYDGDFADFSKQLTADPDVRQFLRGVNECFVQPLRDMPGREMSRLQRLTPQ